MNNNFHNYVFDIYLDTDTLFQVSELNQEMFIFVKSAFYFGINYIIVTLLVTLLHYFEDYDSNLSLALPKLVLRAWIFILLIPIPQHCEACEYIWHQVRELLREVEIIQ